MAKASFCDRLRHILQSIAAIEGYWLEKTFQDFQGSEPLRAATERHLLIISEAVRYIPENDRDGHPQIPWRNITGIGNILRHGYDGIDQERIWSAVQLDLPALKTAIEAMLVNNPA